MLTSISPNKAVLHLFRDMLIRILFQQIQQMSDTISSMIKVITASNNLSHFGLFEVESSNGYNVILNSD